METFGDTFEIYCTSVISTLPIGLKYGIRNRYNKLDFLMFSLFI
jgi:hypothetical protein